MLGISDLYVKGPGKSIEGIMSKLKVVKYY